MKHFVNLKLDSGAQLPYKKHESDAGYDLFAFSEPEIVGELSYYNRSQNLSLYKYIDFIQYKTGLYIQPYNNSEKIRFDLRPRSSISKYNLSLCNSPATIDHDYTGEILVRYNYIFQPCDLCFMGGWGIKVDTAKIYQKGDKICQLLPSVVDTLDIKIVDELETTERADKGFGEGTGK